jgi:hypothetical protein
MRFIPPSKRFVDAEGVRGGPSLAGFALREDDAGGLSVTEIEHFGPMSAATRAAAAFAYRESQSSKRISANGIFARSEIGRVITAAQDHGKSVRIVHDPVDGNPGHAQVRQFTDEDLDLLEHLAEKVFHEYELVCDMQIPSRE